MSCSHRCRRGRGDLEHLLPWWHLRLHFSAMNSCLENGPLAFRKTYLVAWVFRERVKVVGGPSGPERGSEEGCQFFPQRQEAATAVWMGRRPRFLSSSYQEQVPSCTQAALPSLREGRSTQARVPSLAGGLSPAPFFTPVVSSDLRGCPVGM